MKELLRAKIEIAIRDRKPYPDVVALTAALESLEAADYYAARRKAIEDEPSVGPCEAHALYPHENTGFVLDGKPRYSEGPNPCGEIDLGPCIEPDRRGG